MNLFLKVSMYFLFFCMFMAYTAGYFVILMVGFPLAIYEYFSKMTKSYIDTLIEIAKNQFKDN